LDLLKSFIDKYYMFFPIAILIVVFAYWFSYNPTTDLSVSLPGLDSIPANDLSTIEKVDIGAEFKLFEEEISTMKGEWLRFRGSHFDNIVSDNIPLIKSFGSAGPKIVWEVALGEGHAAPVIQKGKVYLLDYLEKEKKDALRCFSLLTGNELWRRSYDVHIKRNHGMSRTIPVISGNFLLTIGPLGHVMCVDPQNGDLKWTLDLVSNYDVQIPFWYTGQCPLIDNGVAILATGGKAILIGVDCESGEILWETPNPDSLQMSHSSVMPMTLGNKKTYVYAAIGGVVGVSADKSDTGKLLWKTNAFDPSVIAPSPLVLKNDEVLLTAGYGAGSARVKIDKNNYKVKVLNAYKPKDGLASEQQTPVLIGDRVYGILPKDAGSLRNQMACYSVNDLNKPLWTSGKTNRFGLGPFIYADGKFYILSDDGTLHIATVNDNGFKLEDSFRVIEGHDAWGPFAIADGRLLMRDSKKMVCLNIRA